MKFYSTKNPSKLVSLDEAVFKGLPEDNGLYMPLFIPKLPETFIQNLSKYSFVEIAHTVACNLLKESLADEEIHSIINRAIDFPAPLVSLSSNIHILELFHGPSLAFKDFGARFMASLMGHFNKKQKTKIVILVATSGDTGGAVAAGFLNTPGIEVVILYPSGKVSILQEKQLTTLGNNITALEIDGTFDDCQSLVKQAFLNEDLTKRINLSSANSINISRLIPQSFYYFEAYKQLKNKGKPVVFAVPSGNFGNLTAGLFAKKMGLPISKFIAATNSNDVIPSYLKTGQFTARPSVPTISNAMDVGNPSNFERMISLFSNSKDNDSDNSFTWNNMKNGIVGCSYTDEETRIGIKEVYENYNYLIEPHGAVGYLALNDYLKQNPETNGIILETAHPSKFIDEVETILNITVEIPERLACLKNKEKMAIQMESDFNPFKNWLLSSYT